MSEPSTQDQAANIGRRWRWSGGSGLVFALVALGVVLLADVTMVAISVFGTDRCDRVSEELDLMGYTSLLACSPMKAAVPAKPVGSLLDRPTG